METSSITLADERRVALEAHGSVTDVLNVTARAEDGTAVACGGIVLSGERGKATALLVVDPDWRRIGLGTALLRRLITEAEAAGLTTFVMTHLGPSAAMRRLVQKATVFHLFKTSDDVLQAEIWVRAALEDSAAA